MRSHAASSAITGDTMLIITSTVIIIIILWPRWRDSQPVAFMNAHNRPIGTHLRPVGRISTSWLDLQKLNQVYVFFNDQASRPLTQCTIIDGGLHSLMIRMEYHAWWIIGIVLIAPTEVLGFDKKIDRINFIKIALDWLVLNFNKSVSFST